MTQEETAAQADKNKGGIWQTLAGIYQRLGMALVLIALVVLMAVIAPNFFSVSNLFEVARQVSVNAILAAGVTFVIITAGIDLSVGSVLGFSALVAVYSASVGVPAPLAIVAAVLAGALIGLINGVLVARFLLASFIVTLAALTYVRGFVYVGTGGSAITAPELGFAFLGSGSIGPVPVPVIVMVLVFALGWFLLNRTAFGLRVFAVGDNPEAARLSGIPVRRVLTWVYIISGACAGLAGLILAARLQSAVPDLGVAYELNAIAAVVLGGTSLSGGKGSMSGTLIGAMIIGVLANGLILLGVPSFYQLIIQGVVIIVAVLIDRLRQSREV